MVSGGTVSTRTSHPILQEDRREAKAPSWLWVAGLVSDPMLLAPSGYPLHGVGYTLFGALRVDGQRPGLEPAWPGKRESQVSSARWLAR
jgi:hypothetical protein